MCQGSYPIVTTTWYVDSKPVEGSFSVEGRGHGLDYILLGGPGYFELGCNSTQKPTYNLTNPIKGPYQLQLQLWSQSQRAQIPNY